jgi:hypothetical protein
LDRLEDVFVVLRGREMALPGPMAPGVAPAVSETPATTEPSTAVSASKQATDTPADATERPGIPHGVRPETEADRLMQQVRQKTAATNPVKPAPAPGTAAPTKPPVAQKPPTNPPTPNNPQP